MKGESYNKPMNMKNNKQGGFLELIVLIIVALLIMKYMGVTVSETVDWFKDFFGSVLR
ncbi:MAG: hypothetical protein M3M85_03515 [bacterium]|nr:hypothetical protein [bacterium]